MQASAGSRHPAPQLLKSLQLRGAGPLCKQAAQREWQLPPPYNCCPCAQAEAAHAVCCRQHGVGGSFTILWLLGMPELRLRMACAAGSTEWAEASPQQRMDVAVMLARLVAESSACRAQLTSAEDSRKELAKELKALRAAQKKCAAGCARSGHPASKLRGGENPDRCGQQIALCGCTATLPARRVEMLNLRTHAASSRGSSVGACTPCSMLSSAPAGGAGVPAWLQACPAHSRIVRDIQGAAQAAGGAAGGVPGAGGAGHARSHGARQGCRQGTLEDTVRSPGSWSR